MRNGRVRYFFSIAGMASVSRNARKRGPPPLPGCGIFVAFARGRAAAVGVRSRRREVFTTPTTISSGMRPARARNSAVDAVCSNCISASVT